MASAAAAAAEAAAAAAAAAGGGAGGGAGAVPAAAAAAAAAAAKAEPEGKRALPHRIAIAARGSTEVRTVVFKLGKKGEEGEWEGETRIEALKSSSGWSGHQYWSTIHSVSHDGSLYYLARGAHALVLLRYSSSDGKPQWTECASHERFTNAQGWSHVQYYSTLRLVELFGKLYVVGRGANELHLSMYDPGSDKWEIKAGHAYLTNTQGWGHAQYYSTIKAVVAASKLVIVGRGSKAVHVAVYDPHDNTWETRTPHKRYSDAAGWNHKDYYESLRAVTLEDRVYLFGRGSKELHLDRYNVVSDKWETLAGYKFMTDAGGWKHAQYLDTIRVVAHQGAVVVLARGSKEVHLARYQPGSNAWETLAGLTQLRNDSGWGQAKYYHTLRVVVAAGRLVLFARGSKELHLYAYNGKTNKWSKLPWHAAMQDKHGWGSQQYYETIRVEAL